MTDAVASPSVRRLSEWDAAELRALTAEYSSPLYVLDLERVRENYRRLEAAFPDADILYAVKANALGTSSRRFARRGWPRVCLRRGGKAGARGRRVRLGGPLHGGQPARGRPRLIVDAWADHPELTVTAGSEDTIDRLADRGYDGRLCLRVNPGIGAGHHEKVRTGAAAKFGVPAERAVDVLADAAERGFDVVGIHAHVGSGVSSDQLEAHQEFVARMGDLSREGADAVGDLEFVDVGGGFGVPYREAEEPLDLESVADATRDAIGEIDAELAIEPGRYFVADAGVLLTEVNTVKDARETTVAGVDAG